MLEKPDPEMEEFQEALLRSLRQAVGGQYARVHTPEEIARRRDQSIAEEAAARKAAS